MTRARAAIDGIRPGTDAVSDLIAQAAAKLARAPAEITPERGVAALRLTSDALTAVHDALGMAVAAVNGAHELTAAALLGGQPGPMLARLEAIERILVGVATRKPDVKQFGEVDLSHPRERLGRLVLLTTDT